MTLEEFIAKHGLKEIDQRDQWVPMELCAENDDGEEMQFFVNEGRTVGLAVNRNKQLVRVAYAELAPAVSDWVPLSESFECPSLA